jgi:hypothetical protein
LAIVNAELRSARRIVADKRVGLLRKGYGQFGFLSVTIDLDGGPVATRTPDLYRVKVAFLIPICFQAPKMLPRAANPHRLRPTIAIRSPSPILFRIALHFQPCGVIHVWTAQYAVQKDNEDDDVYH